MAIQLLTARSMLAAGELTAKTGNLKVAAYQKTSISAGVGTIDSDGAVVISGNASLSYRIFTDKALTVANTTVLIDGQPVKTNMTIQKGAAPGPGTAQEWIISQDLPFNMVKATSRVTFQIGGPAAQETVGGPTLKIRQKTPLYVGCVPAPASDGAQKQLSDLAKNPSAKVKAPLKPKCPPPPGTPRPYHGKNGGGGCGVYATAACNERLSGGATSAAGYTDADLDCLGETIGEDDGGGTEPEDVEKYYRRAGYTNVGHAYLGDKTGNGNISMADVIAKFNSGCDIKLNYYGGDFAHVEAVYDIDGNCLIMNSWKITAKVCRDASGKITHERNPALLKSPIYHILVSWVCP